MIIFHLMIRFYLHQGGTVVGGFSPEDPFTHELTIRLRGSLDASDPDNEDFPTPVGVPNVGWKAIGEYWKLVRKGWKAGGDSARL